MRKIIAVSREFGSGGRELGKRLAEAIGVAYYDREIITAIAQRSGLAEKYVESVSERGLSIQYPIAYGRTFLLRPTVSKGQMDVLVEQQNILQELAEKSDCVIVGRCADVILKTYRPLSLFVYADLESKLQRCRSRQEVGESTSTATLKKQILQIDQQRAKNRAVLTGEKWGDKASHQLCINTSGMEIKALIPAVFSFQECYFSGGCA